MSRPESSIELAHHPSLSRKEGERWTPMEAAGKLQKRDWAGPIEQRSRRPWQSPRDIASTIARRTGRLRPADLQPGWFDLLDPSDTGDDRDGRARDDRRVLHHGLRRGHRH